MSFYKKSKFRGVLRKGKKWQAFIMINRNKNYIGNFETEEEAFDQYVKFLKELGREVNTETEVYKCYLQWKGEQQQSTLEAFI